MKKATLTFFDSHGQPWETCNADAPGAEAFGPTGCARQAAGLSADEADARGVFVPADGPDGWPTLAE